MTRLQLPLFAMLGFVGVIGAGRLLVVQTQLGAPPDKRALVQVVRLTSNEFIGLNGVCRIVDQPNGAIRVTLASGSNLDLAHPADVQSIRAGLKQLSDAGQVQLFEPMTGVVINLSQVTNVWWNEQGMNFWGSDGQAWTHSDPQQHQHTWDRLQERLKDRRALSFAEIMPRVLINLRHLQHASVVNGELRLVMSNKLWPAIQGEANAKAVREVLERVSTTSN
jgi:hypothetical protein